MKDKDLKFLKELDRKAQENFEIVINMYGKDIPYKTESFLDRVKLGCAHCSGLVGNMDLIDDLSGRVFLSYDNDTNQWEITFHGNGYQCINTVSCPACGRELPTKKLYELEDES